MSTTIFELDDEILASALKNGILMKSEQGFFIPIIGIITLAYIQQLEQFVLICTPKNPQEAKMMFLSDFKKTWDLRVPIEIK